MAWRQSVRSFLFFFDSFQLYLYFIIYYNHGEAATARDEKEMKRNEGKNKKLSSLLPVFTFSTGIKELIAEFLSKWWRLPFRRKLQKNCYLTQSCQVDLGSRDSYYWVFIYWSGDGELGFNFWKSQRNFDFSELQIKFNKIQKLRYESWAKSRLAFAESLVIW